MLKEGQNQVTRYVIDDLILDIKRCELRRNDTPIALPKLSFDLLTCLAKSAPALMSPNEIMAIVWQGRVIGDETLKQRVKLLRRALGDDASAPRYIEVVRGQGYRLVPNVKAEFVVAQPPSVMLDLAANDHFPSISGIQQNKWWRRASLTAFVLLMLMFFGFLMTSSTSTMSDANRNVSAANSDLFADIDAKAVKKYHTGIEYYKRYRHTDNDIAIELLNEAINIAPEFSAAYAALSRAYSQRLFQFDGSTEDKQHAIDNAYLALAFDSDSSKAYKALGTAYYVSGWLSKSVNAHLRAFERDDSDVDTASNLAFIYSEQGQFIPALFWHKKALTIQPNSPVAQLHLAITLQRLGKHEDAINWIQHALANKPDYVLAIKHQADFFISAGKSEQATGYLLHELKRYPNHPMLLEALVKSYVAANELTLAQEVVERLIALEVDVYQSAHNQLSLVANKDSRALPQLLNTQQLLKQKQHQGNEHADVSFLLGQIALLQQETKQMIRYWTQAIEQGAIDRARYHRVLGLVNTAMPIEIERKLMALSEDIESGKQQYEQYKPFFDALTSKP